MHIIAFRAEYQLTVDHAKNRVFYQNFGRMQQATALPYYTTDWQAALNEVQPGFHILSDMQVVNHENQTLLHEFQAVEQLIVQRGVHIVAEIHVPGQSPPHHRTVTTARAMPVQRFLNLWDAAQFLDEL